MPECTGVGDCYNVTSIFIVPQDFDTWVGTKVKGFTICQKHIDKTRRVVGSREYFTRRSREAGYIEKGILRVDLKPWMIKKLADKNFQEKEVDTTVVALLVKYAIQKQGDFFAIIAGDADILPAVREAYPEFTENVVLITSHPDEVNAAHRQTAYSFLDFSFKIPPIYLQQHVDKIMFGDHVHRCVGCSKLFSTYKPIPARSQPHCLICKPNRTTQRVR